MTQHHCDDCGSLIFTGTRCDLCHFKSISHCASCMRDIDWRDEPYCDKCRDEIAEQYERDRQVRVEEVK